MDVAIYFIFWSYCPQDGSSIFSKTWLDFIIQKAAVLNPVKTLNHVVTIYVFIADSSITKVPECYSMEKNSSVWVLKVKVNLSLCKP
jgi:hypothetical protein